MMGTAPPPPGPLDLIVEQILGRGQPGRMLVAVDGMGASGKTTMAQQLADLVELQGRPAVILHVDDFFHPRVRRHARGRHSPEGFWLDTYNYDALVTTALRPLLRGGGGRYCDRSLDPATDQVVTPGALTAPDDGIVLVEGTFLHRTELAGFWDYSVFLDIPFAVSGERLIRRNGLPVDEAPRLLSRYSGAQRLYFRQARPWERADLVIDTTTVRDPRTIAAERSFAARWTDHELD